MSAAEWQQSVEVLTFRKYDTAEWAVLQRLALARMWDELRTPWNRRIEAIELVGGGGTLQLPAEFRTPTWVQYAVKMLDHVPDEAIDQAREVSSGPPSGWIVTSVGVGNLAMLLIGGATPYSESHAYVGGYGAPDPGAELALWTRYPAIYTWAGCVEGFQLQGDEQGRDRALATFATELDRANEHAAAFTEQYQGAPQDSIGWRS